MHAPIGFHAIRSMYVKSASLTGVIKNAKTVRPAITIVRILSRPFAISFLNRPMSAMAAMALETIDSQIAEIDSALEQIDESEKALKNS